ncbi:hypothetical protein K435DRAFT_776509 [Dendrothele bispora CBS 962.96]|uniref:Uncharacterized protein n=1 Tax=Dendrothele bispora (strain CBS 962.96) TaxID=1314807 RepID=A0A4S8MDE0_DENBC|nr:hypothetical protein K435DRAFT_776509 [Dendrothele bispora CBS 962.96]
MQCNWFARASCLSRSFPSQNAIKRFPVSTVHLKSSGIFCCRQASTSTVSVDASPSPRQPLTPAKASRASAHAIRIALGSRDIESAFIVAHAVRVSNGPLPAHEETPKYVTDVAVRFPFPVPTCLSMHALLHGLLRQGLATKAHRHAQLMMQAGIRLNPKTLEAIIKETLAQGQVVQPLRNREFFLRMKELLPTGKTKDLFHFHPSFVRDPGIRRAITILQAAKNYKQARTDRMFGAVIRACLLQGELLVASLFFVAIVKDFVVKDALLKQLHSPTISETPDIKKSVLIHYGQLKRTTPGRPGDHHLKDILAFINEELSRDIAGDGTSRQVTLQALAHLAVMLDMRQLPCEASKLIKTLYTCPRFDNKVWVLIGGRKRCINAYEYFHAVLKRQIEALPHHDRRDDKTHSKGLITLDQKLPQWSHSLKLTRSLSLESGNALLHYALRHRFSPLLGNRVIEYLGKDPERNMMDTVTYNTILTSGRVLRAPYMAEQALDAIRRSGNSHYQLRQRPSLPPNMDRTHGERNTRFTRALDHLHQAQLKVPIPANKIIRADNHTLVAYISYLTSTGRPHMVATLLFDLLPELVTISHPAWGDLTRKRINILRRKYLADGLRRTITLGPHFFVAILNALCKAGKTGLAERVWILAKKAERRSWDPYFNTDHEPWVLPVDAYTIMIQVYSHEAKKTPLKILETLKNESNQIRWTPRQNRFVMGWARYQYKLAQKKHLSRGGEEPINLPRSSAGRDSALDVYTSMLRAVYHIYASFKAVLRRKGYVEHTAKLERDLRFPVPDERFFNAMLSITTYHPMMRRRRARTTPAHWRQHLGFANWLYAKFGIPRAFNNLHLKELAQDIVDAGYDLPIGVQYLLVGRGGVTVRSGKAMARSASRGVARDYLDHGSYRTPWAFTRLSKNVASGPFQLRTHKERGLPFGRRPRRAKRFYAVSRKM